MTWITVTENLHKPLELDCDLHLAMKYDQCKGPYHVSCTFPDFPLVIHMTLATAVY